MMHPERARSLTRVTQEHPKGCGIACLAMISGRTYGEIAAAFSDEAIARGVSDYGIMWWLNREGYWSRRSWPDGPAPSVDVALALDDDGHWIVLYGDAVLDPARPTPLARYTVRQVIEVLRPTLEARDADA